MNEIGGLYIGSAIPFELDFNWETNEYGFNNNQWSVNGKYWTEVQENPPDNLFKMEVTLEGPADIIGQPNLSLAMGTDDSVLWLFRTPLTISSGVEFESLASVQVNHKPGDNDFVEYAYTW